ncbi:MAG: hypothetical protein WBB28_24975 [Crinalium sp.]
MIWALLGLVILSFLLAIIYLVFAVKALIYPKSRSGRRRSPVKRNKRVSRKIRDRLYQLVRGDTALAERLVSLARQDNPNRDETWCWEKAIWDLERDRE